MKKIIQYIVLIGLVSALIITWKKPEDSRVFFQNIRRTYIDRPCSKPIEYAIGNVDSKFGLSRDQFTNYVLEAEKAWEEPSGKNLFQLNQEARLKINLIFDERQQQTLETERLEADLDKLEAQRNSAVSKYNSLNTTFNQRMKEYNKDVAEYKERLEEYNREVHKWNSQGGAPEDEYNDLKEEKEKLGDMYEKLEKERKSLNELAQKTNNVIKEENKIVDNYNTSVITYKEKYGDSREFEKGLYDGKEINIYEYRQPQDLSMTLIHELGHALGIGHLDDPASVMYFMIGDQDLENISLTQQDISALKESCMMK